MVKTPQMRLIEERDPSKRDIRIIIREVYAAERTLERAAVRLGIEPSTLCKWVQGFGGEIRSEIVFPRFRSHSRRTNPEGITAGTEAAAA